MFLSIKMLKSIKKKKKKKKNRCKNVGFGLFYISMFKYHEKFDKRQEAI